MVQARKNRSGWGVSEDGGLMFEGSLGDLKKMLSSSKNRLPKGMPDLKKTLAAVQLGDEPMQELDLKSLMSGRGSSLQTVLDATPNASHQLRTEAEAQAALAAFEAAAAAAEAAQRQLMLNSSSSSSSAIAQVLAADHRLHLVAEAYTELQWLHHMAVQQKLQQYGSTAASLPGFAYACLAEAAGQEINKKPGDSISLHELLFMSSPFSSAYQSKITDHILNRIHQFVFGESLASTQAEGTSSSSSSPLQLLAEDLLDLLTRSTAAATAAAGQDVSEQQQQQQLPSDLRLLVLPDLATLLLQSLDSATASGSSSSSSSSSSAAGVSQHFVAALLQQGSAPPAAGSMPLLIKQQLVDFVAALGNKRWAPVQSSRDVDDRLPWKLHCC
jgi:hypothetical protein